jgi:hypothetical protein
MLEQRIEGFVLEAPEKEAEEAAEELEEKRGEIDSIFRGQEEAKQKAQNFRKRQELKELERIIEEKEQEARRRELRREAKEKGESSWADVGEAEEMRAGRKESKSGWSWSSGAEEGARGRRGPALDFSREIKMPPVEVRRRMDTLYCFL